MKGYKGMTKDMTCRGMKFEIGKTYHVDGEISLCKNGLHFCERLIDVFDFYSDNNGNRFFEVDADGIIKTDGKKSVTSTLTVIRELDDIELNKIFYNDGYGYGYGYGKSYGYGYGDGYGHGHGYGNGDGYGHGNGDGYGDGYGHGNRYGNGYGHGSIQKIIKYV